MTMPEPVACFFAELFNVDLVACKQSAGKMLKTCTDQSDNGADQKEGRMTKEKARQIIALYQILYYVLHHGQKRTPLYMNSGVIYDLC